MINNTDSYVIAWRCWYNDNSEKIDEYNSIDHKLEELPEDGFQAMRLWYIDGNGRYMIGNDYYFFCNHPAGTIYGQSNDILEDIVKRYPGASIKRGKHIPDKMIQDINEMMVNSTNPVKIIKTPIPTPVF